jgi:hypothetical protein
LRPLHNFPYYSKHPAHDISYGHLPRLSSDQTASHLPDAVDDLLRIADPL